MGQASTIGLDIAKRVFQAHGADATGRVVFRKRLARNRGKTCGSGAACPSQMVLSEAVEQFSCARLTNLRSVRRAMAA